jgi:hypothetical protein
VTIRPRFLIQWTGPELATLLEALGAAVADGVVELPSARIEIGRADPPAGTQRMRVEMLAPGSPPTTTAMVDVAALGWATVELDHAAMSLGIRFGAGFGPAPADRLLGASVRRSADRSPELLLLEPNTEGRLAGALARHGEGPVAVYLRTTDLMAVERLRVREGDGPLGRQQLFLDGPAAGPFLILVGAAPGRVNRVPSEP